MKPKRATITSHVFSWKTVDEKLRAKIELFMDVQGCWRWRLVASNGEILATSEAYSTKTKCKQTATRLSETTGLPIK